MNIKEAIKLMMQATNLFDDEVIHELRKVYVGFIVYPTIVISKTTLALIQDCWDDYKQFNQEEI